MGVAVKVTGVAEQTGLAETAMETLIDKLLLTVMVIVFEVAGLPVAQVVLDVSITVTWSLFPGV